MMTAQNDIEWYFDFISPFAYLQHKRLEARVSPDAIVYKPVLFAGLLKHWSSKGPAEIPVKRALTYQYCHWLAKKEGIPFKTPPAHPFNPLPALRLAISQHCRAALISEIFDVIWGKGLDITDPDVWQALIVRLQIPDAEVQIVQPWVKEALKDNTRLAIERGLFGVPTMIVKDKLFWGHDMTEMALDCRTDPQQFASEEYKRLENLPIANARKK